MRIKFNCWVCSDARRLTGMRISLTVNFPSFHFSFHRLEEKGTIKEREAGVKMAAAQEESMFKPPPPTNKDSGKLTGMGISCQITSPSV